MRNLWERKGTQGPIPVKPSNVSMEEIDRQLNQAYKTEQKPSPILNDNKGGIRQGRRR